MFGRLSSILQDPLSLLYTLPAIIIGLTVHEWAHAFAADKLGDPTAKNLGRMTLNPFAHIDLFGFLCLLVVGFGWAKPVPVNPRNFKNYRRDDIIVSLAGIAMNLVVAFFATILFYFGVYRWNLGSNEAFYTIFLSIVTINLSLAVFNLLPIYPLDGSHVFESLFMRYIPRFFMFLRQYGQYILIALLVSGLVSTVLGTVVGWLFEGFSSVAIAILRLF
ncbi:MAG: site-2 protease family protein [Clostridium sp.]|nr:site-2 protease family protein [Clostridium sp.]MDD7139657.1 site-2 protease family protein [Clostridium sp.]MDY6081731.1 site-2 protease family protein [Eubacteriales bacterium]